MIVHCWVAIILIAILLITLVFCPDGEIGKAWLISATNAASPVGYDFSKVETKIEST